MDGEDLRLAVRALTGRLGPDDMDSLGASDIWLRTRRSLIQVATDGEVSAMSTPLHYREASSSAFASRARWQWTLKCCCWMSLVRRWTRLRR